MTGPLRALLHAWQYLDNTISYLINANNINNNVSHAIIIHFRPTQDNTKNEKLIYISKYSRY
ncbi:hypothetical protein BpHYR1_036047 [Brachionus plicatilis]|uniref:Uncharacterized protein n=1 Tax=Brachionus plicatilis TaxID=10195 RepID=A0A3M7RYW8_BRAPC|nr:hypothetical protein BpHYR1_036047 [Brachionus plicatilis]